MFIFGSKSSSLWTMRVLVYLCLMLNLKPVTPQCTPCTISFCNNLVYQITSTQSCRQIQEDQNIISFANSNCRPFITDSLCALNNFSSITNAQSGCTVAPPLICQSDCNSINDCLPADLFPCTPGTVVGPDNSCNHINISMYFPPNGSTGSSGGNMTSTGSSAGNMSSMASFSLVVTAWIALLVVVA